MNEEFLVKKYAEFGRLSPNGEIFLPISLGKEFIQDCNEYEIAVIGLEFFHKKEDCIIPVIPANGIDCGEILYKYTQWKETVKYCNSAIIKVMDIEEKRDNIQYFCPALLEEKEWK